MYVRVCVDGSKNMSKISDKDLKTIETACNEYVGKVGKDKYILSILYQAKRFYLRLSGS